jgi:hypothetical protein
VNTNTDNQSSFKSHPYLYYFKDIQWALFGTLTFEDEYRRANTQLAEKLRRADFNHLILTASCGLRIRPKHLAVYQASERDLANNCHYHFLIADHKINVCPVVLAKTLQDLWQSQLRLGRADVRPYERAQGLNGVKYCLKKEFDRNGERERNDYFSKALQRLIKP